jgi:ribosomal-protein-alanine N-acetyltransferase
MSGIKSALGIEARDFHVTRMTEHDLLEVVEIEDTTGLSRWGWEAYHAELGQESSALMFVARKPVEHSLEHEQRIAGFVAARLVGDEVHINNVAVRQSYRRQGIGGLLLETALREGAQRGACSALLEVRETNKAAQSLYKRCGFELVGKRRAYYKEPTEDAFIMRAVIENQACSDRSF